MPFYILPGDQDAEVPGNIRIGRADNAVGDQPAHRRVDVGPVVKVFQVAGYGVEGHEVVDFSEDLYDVSQPLLVVRIEPLFDHQLEHGPGVGGGEHDDAALGVAVPDFYQLFPNVGARLSELTLKK